MADHLLLTEGYRLVQRPQPTTPAQGPHVVLMLQPYWDPGLDKGLLPRRTPPLPPPRALTYGAFGQLPTF